MQKGCIRVAFDHRYLYIFCTNAKYIDIWRLHSLLKSYKFIIKMKVEKQEVRDLFVSLKRVSDLYEKVNEEQRGRLLVACQKLFDRGEGLGMDRVWLETLVIGGKDFLESLYREGSEVAEEHDAKIIFS